MNEWLVGVSIAFFACSGLVALLASARRASDWIHVVMLSLGSVFGMVAALRALAGLVSPPWISPWRLPGGVLHVHVDALSAVFLFSVCLLSPLASIYAVGYYPAAKKGRRAKRLRIYFGWMTAGMALLVVAKNSLLFLMGWEVMALSAFMALAIEDDDARVRQASLVYLIATRIGTLCILGTFALLRAQVGSFSLSVHGVRPDTGLATGAFVLGMVGFGLKAGMIPLHVWLPDAHANAPTHVSALMSGVLIKMGVYGLLRLTSLYSPVPLWWGMVVLGVALTSALFGVAFALGQHDLKRLLAYHSVENIGIILLGIAIGLLGRALGAPSLVFMGYAGALLHVLNHGLFKALLFLGGGAVISTTGTRNIELLGGLMGKLPLTSATFLLGCVAITGLPPLNGFVSELYLYLAMFGAQRGALGGTATALAFAVPVLAMVGALALACFVKVYAVVFLGQARSTRCQGVTDVPWSMRLPQIVLALACVTIGIFPHVPIGILRGAVHVLGSAHVPKYHGDLSRLTWLNLGLCVGFLFALVASSRRRVAASVPTWDCGYVAPSARMQYSASSIAADLVDLFSSVLRPRISSALPDSVLPKSTRFESHVPETVLERLVLPAVRGAAQLASLLRSIQRGTAHVYLLYVLFTLLIMLAIWR
ncbi:MAG: proton-conducting transporter membrane subunit [Polyangiaceae bacterium]